MSRTVLVPAGRLARWVSNFVERHGPTSYAAGPGLRGDAEDGSWFCATLPFDQSYEGTPDPAAFLDAWSPPEDWGVLVARRGGFAVARVHGERIVSSKVGQRPVQGRTKAGGQSQQRFARRRDNQARAAWQAAADHATTHLGSLRGPLAVGGDPAGLATVLEVAGLGHLPQRRLADVPGEPRRASLEAAVVEALSFTVEVHNA